MTKFYPGLHLIKSLLIILLIQTLCFSQDNQETKLAESYMRSGNYDSALLIFQKQFRQGNQSPRVINGISSCLEALNRTEDLITFLESVIAKNPGVFTYEIDLANAYYLNKDTGKARDMWRIVYETPPPNLMRYRLVAQAMTRFRLFDDAIEVYKLAMKNLPNQEAVNLDIGTLYRAQLNYEKAVEHYITYFNHFKKQQGYIRSLLIGMAKDEESTNRIIAKLEEVNTKNDPDINELLANLYMRNKDYDHAFKIIKNIEENTAGTRYVYLSRFAEEAERDKEYGYVIKAYEYVIGQNNESLNAATNLKLADAYYMFGRSLFNTQKKESAEIQIQKSLDILKKVLTQKSPEKYFAAELCGDIYKDYFNDLDRSLEYYSDIDLRAIGNSNADQVKLKMADIYILKNELARARTIYSQVKNKGYSSYALFYNAELNYYQAQFKKAAKMYNELISTVGMKDTLANNALERIFEIEQFAKDSTVFAKYAAADLLKRQNKISEAAKQFSEIYYSYKSISPRAGIKAVELYRSLKKTDQVIALLEDRMQKYPDNENNDWAILMLAESYKNNESYEQALTLYQDLLVRYPTSFYIDTARDNARQLNKLIQEKATP